MSADFREESLAMVAAFAALLRIRLAPLAHGPAAESRAWDRLYLAARAVEDAAYPARGVTITNSTPGALSAAASRCRAAHDLASFANPCDLCLAYYGLPRSS